MGLVNGDNQEILPGIRAYTGGKHPSVAIHLGEHEIRYGSCSRRTTCTCTRTWRSTPRSRRRSMPSRICARKIA
jgi:hypothetical protein